MEWIETTARTIEEAKDLALDSLGVDDSEVEFEVVEEPRQGLFGRTRGQARVRARVAPKAPRAKEERRDRKRRPKGGKAKSGNQGGGGGRAAVAGQAGSGQGSGNQGSGNQGSGGQRGGQSKDGGRNRNSRNEGSNDRGQRSGRSRAERPKVEDSPMEDVQACVKEFLTGLTAAFGIDTSVELETEDEYITAHIEGKHGLLLGPKARTLDAIQELTRVTAQRATPSSARIKVDVGGYREARKVALAGFAKQAADRALADQSEVVLEPMSAADRKVVHDALNEVAGVSTRSAGNDPNRRVVVVPDEESTDQDAAQNGAAEDGAAEDAGSEENADD